MSAETPVFCGVLPLLLTVPLLLPDRQRNPGILRAGYTATAARTTVAAGVHKTE